MALRRGRVARRVIGFARTEATIRRAKAKGAVDDACTELCPDWLGLSDLVVIATPPLAVPKIAREIARICPGRLALTDVASTKSVIVRKVEQMLPDRISFVGAHPMAGSERSGIEAADPHLFDEAVCILTPTRKTNRVALGKVRRLWQGVGAQVRRMTPAQHDELVAQVSHVPHLAAVALTLLPPAGALKLSGNGFADTTRVAMGDPKLWEEVCSTNHAEISRSLDRYIAKLKDLRDSHSLQRELARAQRIRQGLRK